MSIRLGRQTIELLNVKQRLDQAEEKVDRLSDKKDQLAIELRHKQSEAYIERQIRDKLLLTRTGDITIDLDIPQSQSVETDNTEQIGDQTTIPNWKKWLNDF